MIKVVQILGKLDRGGIETWLKDVVLNYDKDKFKIDFIFTGNGEGAYDSIVSDAGSVLHKIPVSKGIWHFSIDLYKTLKKEKYGVVHAHPHYFCGVICFVAFLAGVPLRISHSHNDTSNIDNNSSLSRKIYHKLQRVLIKLFSNKKLACSSVAGEALFGDSPFDVIYCGVDFSNFLRGENSMKAELIKKWNLPDDTVFVGHVGRFFEQKNHKFLIEVFNILSRKVPNAYLLLIGEGPLMEDVKKQVSDLGLKNVKFLGGTNDVNIYMRDLFDVFVFPSLYEGLGIVILEAQAAGLKCFISDTIPAEVVMVDENVIFISLDDDPQDWAFAIYVALHNLDNVDYKRIAEKVNNSPFSITYSVNALETIYSHGRNV